MHRVQAMSASKGSFESRIPLHQAWRGLRGEELRKISGIEDAEFVHNTGFVGGAWSLPSAIKMAEITIEEFKKQKDSEQKKQE